jgi:DNA-directed RNA polymerase subunit RPC12/RpoP
MSAPPPSGSGPVACARCGTVNTADDQFCGSCGAELATPPPAGGEPRPEASLVRCPSCGTANQSGRSFCQRCGSKLADATPVAARAPGTAVAPVSAMPPPASGARPAVPGARRADPVDRPGGMSSWLLLAGAGILVGALVVIVALMAGSGQPPPPAGASAAPSTGEPRSPEPSLRPSGGPDESGATDLLVGWSYAERRAMP